MQQVNEPVQPLDVPGQGPVWLADPLCEQLHWDLKHIHTHILKNIPDQRDDTKLLGPFLFRFYCLQLYTLFLHAFLFFLNQQIILCYLILSLVSFVHNAKQHYYVFLIISRLLYI